jgi:hypothetical protein
LSTTGDKIGQPDPAAEGGNGAVAALGVADNADRLTVD